MIISPIKILEYASNLLFLWMCWRQHRNTYADESKWQNQTGFVFKFFKYVRATTMSVPEARRQLHLEVIKHAFPFLAWLIFSKILVGISGGNVVLGLLMDVGLAVLILVPLALVFLMFRKNQLYPENFIGRWVRKDCVSIIQEDLLERLEKIDGVSKTEQERLSLLPEKEFLNPQVGYDYAKKYERCEGWEVPSGEEALVWGAYLNNAELFSQGLAEVNAKKTDEELHQDFLDSERQGRYLFLIIAGIVFAPLLLGTVGQIFNALF